MARGRGKKGKIQMPPNEKEEPLQNLKDKFRSIFGLKTPQEKKKGLSLKDHFSIWYSMYCYGKECSKFNRLKME